MVSSCLHSRFLAALPQKKICSSAQMLLSRMPKLAASIAKEGKDKRRKEKNNKTPLETKIKNGSRSTLQSESTPYQDLKRAARTLITERKILSPNRFFPFAPALLLLVLFSYPCSCVMNYYAHAHAVDGWLLQGAAIKIWNSRMPFDREFPLHG